MEQLNTAIVRIVTRYLSGGLVAVGMSLEAAQDVAGSGEVQGLIVAGVGLLTGAVTEWFYAQARKDGNAL